MEAIRVLLTDKDYDRLVHTGLPEYGDVTIAVKKRATMSDKAGVVIAFSVYIDGKKVAVQAAITAANFLTAAAAVKGYTESDVP